MRKKKEEELPESKTKKRKSDSKNVTAREERGKSPSGEAAGEKKKKRVSGKSAAKKEEGSETPENSGDEVEEPRRGRQTPTRGFVIPYKDTKGGEAVELYEKSGKSALPWQSLLIFDMMAIREDGLWVHSRFGYSVPRQNGKNEIVSIRELYGLTRGEKLLHTAHRTATSHTAWERLCGLIAKAGYKEGFHYKTTKQFGLEHIEMLDGSGGVINFRTRSSKGGLGETYDTLIIDEAQEYTLDQESALKYVIAAARNPQTLLLGTPPTAVSAGTVFPNMRLDTLSGGADETGWAEWGVDEMSNVRDIDLWYETNPSLGYTLSERNVKAEIGDDVDFNIQRLGLWIKYNQKSAISAEEWGELAVDKLPVLSSERFMGIKFGVDGVNVALSVAARTAEGKIFVECVDCCSVRDGVGWLLPFLQNPHLKKSVCDGASGQQILCDELKKVRMKLPLLPKVAEVVAAHSAFEQELFAGNLQHRAQPSFVRVVSNCEKRMIGSNGGWGYKSLLEGADVAILESAVLAVWACSISKEKKVQQARY